MSLLHICINRRQRRGTLEIPKGIGADVTHREKAGIGILRIGKFLYFEN